MQLVLCSDTKQTSITERGKSDKKLPHFESFATFSGKKRRKISIKYSTLIKKEEICSIINPKNYGKKNLLDFAEKIGNFTLNVTMVDKAGNPLTADDISQCHLPGFPILFTQNELLEILAKEIFKQQFLWKSVQDKDIKECNKEERIIKQIPLMPRCPDVLKGLFHCIEIRDERSPKHAIAYKSCLGKLEEMVKDQWDDWNKNQS